MVLQEVRMAETMKAASPFSTEVSLPFVLTSQVVMANPGSTAPISCLLLRVPSSYKTQPAEAVNPLLSPNATGVQELSSLVRAGHWETVGREKPPVSFLVAHPACSKLSQELQSHRSKQEKLERQAPLFLNKEDKVKRC